MYPDLSYFLHDIFGTAPDNWTSIFKTFGLLLVLAILASALFLYWEMKRKEAQGIFKPEELKVVTGKPASTSEIISNAIFGFILGFKLLYIFNNFAEFQKDAADVVLSAKGNWIGGILAAILFGAYQFWDKNRKKLAKPKVEKVKIYPSDRIGDITVIAAVSGIIGAKVFDILEDLPAFFQDPIGMLISGGGLAIYGGLIFGYIGVVWYLKRKNISVIHMMDAVAPALIVGYGVGRLGCQFSGDGDWGIVNTLAQPSWWFLPDWMWAYDYPNNVINQGIAIEGCEFNYCSKLENPVFPTPIYEVIMSFTIAGILWALRKRIQIAGMLFFIYLILNGFERFWIEKIRVNKKYDWGGVEFTQAEFIAVALMLTGVVGCYVLWKRARQGQAKPV